MSGANQHTLPQFLQRGFTAKKVRSGSLVYVYGRRCQGVLTLTEKVGYGRYFYSKATEPNLDDLITGLENRDYAPLINALRAGKGDLEVHEPLLPELVVHLFLRTAHLRNNFTSFMRTTALEFVERITDVEFCARAVLAQTPGVRIRNPDEASPLLAIARDVVCRGLPQLRESLIKAVDLLPVSIKNAQIDAMLRDVRARNHVAHYAGFRWYTLHSDRPLVLGDCAVVFEGQRGSRRFRSLPESYSEVSRIWLPISHDRVVVGSPNKRHPKLDAAILNRASVSCSLELFISSKELAKDSTLPTCLGKWSDICTKEEQEHLLRTALEDLLQPAD